MADTPETPTTGTETPAATPRRRAARGTGTARATGAEKPAGGRRRKSVAQDATDAVKTTATRAKRAVKKAEDATVDAVTSTTRKASTRGGARTAAAAKPARKAPARSGRKKAGSNWGVAAIAGGLAAAGAAAAALLSLRGSSNTPKTAHQPDGTDASKSFDAGIADENTIPN